MSPRLETPKRRLWCGLERDATELKPDEWGDYALVRRQPWAYVLMMAKGLHDGRHALY